MQEQQPQSNDRDAWRRYVTLLERGTAADNAELIDLAARLGRNSPATDRCWIEDVRRCRRLIREGKELEGEAERLRLALMQNSERLAAAGRDGRHLHPQHPVHGLRQTMGRLEAEQAGVNEEIGKAAEAARTIGFLTGMYPELVAAVMELES